MRKIVRILAEKILYAIKCRPMIPVFMAVVTWCVVYITLTWKFPVLAVEEGGKISLTGTVTGKEYSIDGDLTTVRVDSAQVYVKNCRLLTEPVLGSKVTVNGEIYSFEPPLNRGGFDQRSYYAARGCYFYVFADRFTVDSIPKHYFSENILRTRLNIFTKLKRYAPFEYGSVATLLMGDKRGLSEERRDLYKRAGCFHFLIISGMHVSAIGYCVYEICKRITYSIKAGCIMALLIVISYGIFVGFSVSVVRAVIMYGIRLLADILCANYDMLNASLVAGIVTLIKNPLLLTDSAFIYSYVTVFSIALIIEGRFLPKNKLLKNACFSYLLFLFLLPVNLSLSYEASVCSFIINAMLVPVSGVVLGVSALVLLFSLLSLGGLAAVSDTILAIMLRSLDVLCKLTARLPSLRLVGKPLAWQVVLYYCVLIYALFYIGGKAGKAVLQGLLIANVFFIGTTFSFIKYFSALYIGQGDCLVLRTGRESVVMMDCGSSDRKEIVRYDVAPFLYSEGIRSIECLFLSHADADHINGIWDLLEEVNDRRLEIQMLAVTEVSIESEEITELARRALSLNIPVVKLAKGQVVETSGWSFVCLSPDGRRKYSDVNSASMVIMAKNDESGESILLTGDIDAKLEQELVENAQLPSYISILKCAHHGSNTATSAYLLDNVEFGCAIVSAGQRNRYGHPHQEVLKRLKQASIPVYRTDLDGEIDIRLGRGPARMRRRW